MKHLVILMAASVLTATGFAKNIIWTGAVNSTWDKGATANWKDASTGDPCTFAAGDAVTFDDTAENPNVVVSAAALKPSAVTFANSVDYTLHASKGAYVDATASKIEKSGRGLLTITTESQNGPFKTTCDVEIKAGRIKLDTSNYTCLLGDGATGYSIFVRNGATLEAAWRNMFTKEVRLTIDKGGTFTTSGSQWMKNTFGNLSLNGGDFLNPVAGSGTYGFLHIENVFGFSGDTPYVIDQYPGKAGQYLCLAEATEFRVDDITESDVVDATICLKMIDEISPATVGGFVKTGAGTLLISGTNTAYTSQGKDNSFTGDIIVSNGTLMVGVDAAVECILPNILGSTDVDRTVTIEEGATFRFPNRNLFGAVQAVENPVSKLDWVVKGTLAIDNGQGEVLGNVTFDGGSLKPSYGLSNFGRLMVAGTMAFKGAKSYSFPLYPGTAAKPNGFMLNGNPETVFDVQDVAGLATFDVPFIISGGYFNLLKKTPATPEHKFGFRKTGPGTMRIAAAKLPNEVVDTGDSPYKYTNRGFNGTASVEAGTLAIDGNISVAEGVAVSSGASLAGTGTVQNVTLADGAGWRIRVTDANPLEIKGNLTVSGTPRIDVEAGTSGTKRAVAKVTGTITGSFDGAPVYVNGVLDGSWKATIRDNELIVGETKGLLLILR